MNVKTMAIVGIMLMLFFSNTMTCSYEKTESGNLIDRSNDGNILYVGGSGPNNYTRIQDAINDASDGDTIIVYPGTYKENIFVYKILRIVGIDYPVIMPENKSRDTIIIVMWNCTIEGFNITGCEWSGLLLLNAFCTVKNNIFYKNWYSGIIVDEGLRANIVSNIFKKSWYCGIYVEWGSHLMIVNNTFYRTGHGIQGDMDESIITRNFFFGERDGHNGIQVSGNGKIYENVIKEYDTGIEVSGKWNVTHNNIFSNEVGIFCLAFRGLIRSEKTRIFENNISFNKKGIHLMNYGNAEIYSNNFVGNKIGASFWDSYFIFWHNNYWDDWHLPLPKPIHGTNAWFIPWIQFDWIPSLRPIEWWENE